MPSAHEQILVEAETRLGSISGLFVFRSKTENDFERFPFAVLNMGESVLPEDIQPHGRDRYQMLFTITMGVRPPDPNPPTAPRTALDTALNELHRDIIVALLGNDPSFAGMGLVLQTDRGGPEYGDEQGHGNTATQDISFIADFQTLQHDPDSLITG